MMTQIHEVLDQGIRELLRTQSSSFEMAQLPILDKIQSDLNSIGSSFKKSLPSTTFEEFFAPGGTFQSSLNSSISKEIKKVLSPIPDTLTRTNSLLSPSEVRELDLKTEIDRDLENESYEKAFTTALGSTDLSNVLVSS